MWQRHTELLKALALGEVTGADHASDNFDEAERERYYVLTLALFAGAVGHRLGGEPERSDVDAFVHELNLDYEDDDSQVNFLAVEAVVRAVFGEDHLIDDLSSRDQYLAQLPAIRKVVAQSDDLRDRLDDYLAEADSLASEWAGETE